MSNGSLSAKDWEFIQKSYGYGASSQRKKEQDEISETERYTLRNPVPEEQGFFDDVVDSVQMGAWQGASDLARGLGAIFDSDWLNQAADVAAKYAEENKETMSTKMREALEQNAFDDWDVENGKGRGIANIYWWAGNFGALIGQNLDIVVPTKIATSGVKMAGKAAGKFFTKETAEQVSKAAIKEAEKRGAPNHLLCTIGLTAAQSAMAAGSRANQVRDEIDELGDEKLAQLEGFRQTYWDLKNSEEGQNLDHNTLFDEAKERFKFNAGRDAALDLGAIATDVSVNAISGLGGGVWGAKFPPFGNTQSISKGIAKGVGIEAGTEALQGAVEQRAINETAQQFYDPTRDINQDVSRNAIDGAILGGAFGGAMGGIEARSHRNTMNREKKRLLEAVSTGDERVDEQIRAQVEAYNRMANELEELISPQRLQQVVDRAKYREQVNAEILAQRAEDARIKANTPYHQRNLADIQAEFIQNGFDENDFNDFVEANLQQATTELQNLQTNPFKMGADFQKGLAEKQAYNAKLADAQARVDYFTRAKNAPKFGTEPISSTNQMNTPPSVQQGANTSIELGTQGSRNASYELVEAGDLNVNLKPNQYQNRDRTSIDSQMQISAYASKLNPAYLGASVDVTQGAPTVDGRYGVFAGNGRLSAIKQAYAHYPQQAAGYKQFLADNASSFGFSAEQVEAMQNPVLIRKVNENFDVTRAVEDSNYNTGLDKGVLGTAKETANHLTNDLLREVQINEDGTLNLSESNTPFIQTLLSRIPVEQRPKFFAETRMGNQTSYSLTAQGRELVENALLVKAYENAADPTYSQNLLTDLIVSTDEQSKRVKNALISIAGKVIQTKGNLDFDISQEINEAYALMRKGKQAGLSVDEALAQQDFVDPTSPRVKALARLFYSPKSVKDVQAPLNHYLDSVIHSHLDQVEQNSMFGDELAISKDELLRDAGFRFSRSAPQETQSFYETEQRLGGKEAYEQAVKEGKTELDYRQWVQVRTPEFKAWFGDWENDPQNASKVINPKTGEPLVVYHGTNAEFNTFDKSKQRNDRNQYGEGFYFTGKKETADLFGSNTKDVFLRTRYTHMDRILAKRKGENIDHMPVDYMRPDDSRDIWVVRNPNQIKSATDNTGEFDVNNDDIRFSKALQKPERLEKLRQSQPIEITGTEIKPSDDIREYKRNALEYGKSLRGSYVNKDTGKAIELGAGGVKEILQHDYKDIEHLQSIAAIPQIIENAIYIDTLPNEDVKNPHINAYEYYVAGLKIDGVDYTVKAAVGISPYGDRYYDHKLTKIEKGKLLEARHSDNKSGVPQQQIALGEINDKRLLQILQPKNQPFDFTHEKSQIATAVGKGLSKHFDVAHSSELGINDPTIEAAYNTKTGKIVIIADNIRANSILSREERLKWVAWHELAHRGLQVRFGGAFRDLMQTADRNSTVNALATALQKDRSELKDNRILAVEEAIAELHAAYTTGKMEELKSRYGLEIPLGKEKSLKAWFKMTAERIREVMAKLFGLETANRFSHDDLLNLLKDIQQSAGGDVNGVESDVRHSFAGENAKTANHSLLAQAKSAVANGANPEEIRKQTGWFQGVDGKWRFEIDDSQVQVKNALGKTIGEVLDAPLLFKAYPDLAQIAVQKLHDEYSKGEYNRLDNFIGVNNKLTEDELKSVLLHELQHAIQMRENFARGGSNATKNHLIQMKERELEQLRDDAISLRKLDKEARYLQWQADGIKLAQLNKQGRIDVENSELFYNFLANSPQAKEIEAIYEHLLTETDKQKQQQIIHSLIPAWLENDIPKGYAPLVYANELAQLAREKQQVLALPENKAILREFDRLEGELNNLQNTSADFVYNRLAGEVEARNVQARLDMNKQERINRSPFKTQGLNKDNQLVYFGDEVNYSLNEDPNSSFANAIPKRTATSFDEARSIVSELLGEPLVNKETGMVATVSKRSLEKLLSGKAAHKSSNLKDHLTAVANIDQLFENAILGWTEQHKNADPNISGVHKLFAPLNIDGQVKLAKLTVKEMAFNQGNRMYSVETIEVENENGILGNLEARADVNQPTSPQNADVQSLIQRIQKFNSGDQRYRFSRSQSNVERLRGLNQPTKLDNMKDVAKAMANRPLSEWKALMVEYGKQANTKIFDALAPIKYAEDKAGITDHSQSAYTAARLAAGSASIAEASMLYGLPEYREGIIQRKNGTTEKDALFGILQALGNDANDFLAWVAGNRADKLMQEGRENHFSQAEIDELKALNRGREQRFEQARQKLMAWNQSLLDLAEHSGLINQEDRAKWEDKDFYIPFYREDDDGDAIAPYRNKGLSGQNAGIKRLKGSDKAINDLLENVITNATKLIDASVKNAAMTKAVTNLADTGVISLIENPTYADWKKLGSNKHGADKDGGVAMVRIEGKEQMVRINDAMLFNAITSIDQQPLDYPFRKLFAGPKRVLTATVTSMPNFIVRNFLRDMAQAWVVDKNNGFKLGMDSIKGLKDAYKRSGSSIDLMFAGASFGAGYVNGGNPEQAATQIRRYLRKQGKSATEIDGFMDGVIFSKDQLMDLYGKYKHLNHAAENANRIAVYDRAIASGKSKAQAALESKDLMDFSMHGSAKALRVLGDVLPFFNARLQGMSQLGRAFKDNPRELAKRGAIIALASVALAAMNQGEEWYEEQSDEIKDNFWLANIGGQIIKIPKPFELGVVFGTIPERLFRTMSGADDTGRFKDRLLSAISNTLSLNPIPQAVKPIFEVYNNYDSFRGREIETLSDRRLLKEARFDDRTSLFSRGIAGATSVFGLSPKQTDHLIHGYFGTLGMYVLGMSDVAIRQAGGYGELPAKNWSEYPVLDAVFGGDVMVPRKYTRYMNDYYHFLNQVSEISATVNSYKADGRKAEAKLLLAENQRLLAYKPVLSQTQKELKAIKAKMDAIQNNGNLSAAEKRQRLDRLRENKNAIVRTVVERMEKEDF